MAGSYSAQSNPGMMLPTTSVWDVSQIYAIEELSPELRELLVRLYQNLNNMALAVNLKDTGYYTLQEFLSSQAFFPNPINTAESATSPVYRQAFRKVINIGGLPSSGTLSIPHYININEGYSFTRIYGTATQTGPSGPFSAIPLPYASASTNCNIELTVDNAYVHITINIDSIDYSGYNICYVILEYIKS